MSRSLGRVVDILNCFTVDRPTATLTEVSDRTGLDRATTYRFLTALEGYGVLRRDPATKRYALGGKLMEWGALALGASDLRALADPILRRLNEASEETTALYLRDGTRRVCIATYDSPHRIRHVLPVGNALPITVAAGGVATLAFLPGDEALALIDADERLTPDERAALLADLPRVRAQGYASGIRLMTPHAWSIAAPVWDARGQPNVTLVIAGPDSRIDDERIARYGELLLPAARELSRALGAPERVLGYEGRGTRDEGRDATRRLGSGLGDDGRVAAGTGRDQS